MTTQVDRLLDDLRSVLHDPGADPQKTVLFIAIGTVLLLIVLAVILAIASPGARRRPGGRPHTARVLKGYLAVGLIVLAAGLYLGTNEITTAPEFCARCHETAPWVESWRASTHRDADCMGCHDRPGVTGHLTARLIAISNLVAHIRATGSSSLGGPALSNDGCVGCHQDQIDAVTETDAVRVRHSDILEQGARCTTCHGEAGHGPAPGRPVPAMSDCVACHDGTRAPDGCPTCHLTDIATVREIPSDYPRATVTGPLTCDGCHPSEECRECHRIDMPHPPGFSDPFLHAPPAAFEKKDEVCLRCHTMADCVGCHTGADIATDTWTGHAPAWKSDHQKATRDGASCRGCHTGVENMCDLCHPPG